MPTYFPMHSQKCLSSNEKIPTKKQLNKERSPIAMKIDTITKLFWVMRFVALISILFNDYISNDIIQAISMAQWVIDFLFSLYISTTSL